MFAYRDHVAGVDVGVTDRDGGVSGTAYASLNLARHVGDAPLAVSENRARVACALGLTPDRLVFMDQCHGADVAVVSGVSDPPPQVDALVTTAPDLALVAMVADCVPVMLADSASGVIGIAHAGRPGMMAGVVPAVLAAMRSCGAGEIQAWVGPSVCPRCYEVPEALAQAAAGVSPEARSRSWVGTPSIDVAAAVVGQLVDEGVGITWVAGCTRERGDLYSYRRDGATGRFAGVIVRRST